MLCRIGTAVSAFGFRSRPETRTASSARERPLLSNQVLNFFLAPSRKGPHPTRTFITKDLTQEMLVNDQRLGPAFRFYNRHRVVDEKGKVLGYKNLAELREDLQPVLLRRTRQSVRQQLPPRTNELVRITPTQEQLDLHGSHMQIVRQITQKKFLTEMDLLRLQ